MTPQTPDPLLGAAIMALAITSVGTWFALADRLKQGTILRYEPRQPVPWHGVWTLLPIGMVALNVYGAVFGAESATDAAHDTTRDYVERIALGTTQQLAFVAAFLATVIIVSRASRADLGLPGSLAQFGNDVWIGVVAWLAALMPVYGMQVVLVTLTGPAEGHPLIKIIQGHPNPALYGLAFAAAVVAAPVCEELLFRLLLQGWLEKWEDRRLGWGSAEQYDGTLEASDEAQMSSDEGLTSAGVDPADGDSSLVIGHSSSARSAVPPPAAGVGGLPHGWLPIIVSSTLFALAHVGYGPDPVPLFLLALILGYVYQRTHRIVPCIVAHALFNGASLMALWRMLSAGGP